jgi:hypothetical protein
MIAMTPPFWNPKKERKGSSAVFSQLPSPKTLKRASQRAQFMEKLPKELFIAPQMVNPH